MSVIMTMQVEGDPKALEQFVSDNSQEDGERPGSG